MNAFEKQWQKITALCLAEKSKNPIEIMCKLMDLEFCNVRGHEHHMMVSAALLTAYFNALSKDNSVNECGNASMNLSQALQKLESMEEFNIGGDCDYWSGCRAVSGARAFWSIISNQNELFNMLTMEAANAVSSVCGQRCCKRSAYLVISKVAEFVKNHLGTQMELTEFVCKYSSQNRNCLLEDCPYNENYIKF